MAIVLLCARRDELAAKYDYRVRNTTDPRLPAVDTAPAAPRPNVFLAVVDVANQYILKKEVAPQIPFAVVSRFGDTSDYRAAKSVNGKGKSLGRHPLAEEAAKAWCASDLKQATDPCHIALGVKFVTSSLLKSTNAVTVESICRFPQISYPFVTVPPVNIHSQG